MKATVYTPPRVAAILPCSSVMFAPYSASTMDTWGGGVVQEAPSSAKRQVRLGGNVEARRSALWWLVWTVEGLVKQVTDSWDIARIHAQLL